MTIFPRLPLLMPKCFLCHLGPAYFLPHPSCPSARRLSRYHNFSSWRSMSYNRSQWSRHLTDTKPQQPALEGCHTTRTSLIVNGYKKGLARARSPEVLCSKPLRVRYRYDCTRARLSSSVRDVTSSDRDRGRDNMLVDMFGGTKTRTTTTTYLKPVIGDA